MSYDVHDYTNSTWTDIPVVGESNINPNTGLEVKGDLVVQDRNVLQELDEMRDALMLIKRDIDMEKKYPKLKELKDAYEAHLEKYKTLEALK